MKRIATTLFLIHALQLFSGDDYSFLGARSAGMANASLILTDVWSVQQNPANLAFVRNISAGTYYENRFLLNTLSNKAVVASIPLKKATVGLLVNHFGYALYSENKYALSFAKALGQNFSAGLSLDYLNTFIGEGYGSKGLLITEAGIYSRCSKNLSIAAHVFNPARVVISDYYNERISSVFRLGAGYHFSDKVLFTLETEKNIRYRAVFKTGVEYKPTDNLFLRAGIGNGPNPTAMGFGIMIKNLQLDISACYHQSLGFSTQYSLTYSVLKKQEIYSD